MFFYYHQDVLFIHIHTCCIYIFKWLLYHIFYSKTFFPIILLLISALFSSKIHGYMVNQILHYLQYGAIIVYLLGMHWAYTVCLKRSQHSHNTDSLLTACLVPQNYLKQFYNLTEDPTPSRRRGGGQRSSVLSEMQRFFKLKVTGVLDSETLEVMKKPRCGVPDVARYSTFGQDLKWRTNKLTYRYFSSHYAHVKTFWLKNTLKVTKTQLLTYLLKTLIGYLRQMYYFRSEDIILLQGKLYIT